VLGSLFLGGLGVVAALWAERIDQIAAFQNFIILPLTFLSGVFYTVESLPSFWQTVMRFNPFFIWLMARVLAFLVFMKPILIWVSSLYCYTRLPYY